MGLEGNLRDLELQEVLQLLAHSRKTGRLHISAQLAGRSATISFSRGAIVDARIRALTATADTSSEVPDRAGVEGTALELLTWREGEFRFAPLDVVADTGVRLNAEMILVEGARRLETWTRISDRIPHARAVPAFASVEPTQLPLLHLMPQQWEVLTRVDGQRDLVALADTLGRDLVDVADTVHGLIETGLLVILDSARTTRTHETPPSTTVVAHPTPARVDVWVPVRGEGRAGTMMTDPNGYDAVFDPVRVGVVTPEGLPSLPEGDEPATVVSNHHDCRRLGDVAALRGDFIEALSQWSASLKLREHGADADHAREAIALVARLHALLFTTARN